MFHQRNIIKAYFVIAASVGLGLSGVIGSFIVSYLIVLVVSVPIVAVITKVFPAPDWYKNEAEKTGMVSVNISSRDD